MLERFRPGKAAFAAFGKRDRAVGVPLIVESVRGHHHEQVQSRAGLRVVSEVGTRLPLHCTSQGKVFLSAMADHEAKRVLSRRTLEPYTPKTLVTWEELFRVMQAARENGYAVEEGEYRFGLCSASAPVRDSSGAVRYAVGFVGMFDSVRSPDFQRDIDLTCAAAAQISTALGYRA